MKFVELTNVSPEGLRITQVRLYFNPGETKKVHPATVKHPSVQQYIGSKLSTDTKQKAEPIAPDTQPAPEPAPEPVPEDIQPSEVPVEEPVAEPATETEEAPVDTEAGESGNLRELYISAPGITEENVEAVLAAFPSVADLAGTTKKALQDCGVSKNSAKRVLEWAKAQN